METVTVGLWAANLEQPMRSLPAWTDALGRRVEEARAAGAGLLLLPELACMQWLAFGPADPSPAGGVDWLASVAAEAEVWPGSWPAHRLAIRDPIPLHRPERRQPTEEDHDVVR